MLSKKMEKMLNEQIKNEFYSAYFYLSIATWMEAKELAGFANWFRIQTQEERDHAMMMLDFLVTVGGKPTYLPIETPPLEFASPMDAFSKTLEHEQFITKRIYELMDVAQEERDYKTIHFLQWYVNEQVEEENNVQRLIEKMKIADNSQAGVLYLDGELATRVYAPPSIMQNQGN